MRKDNNIITALDIGSETIKGMVAQNRDDEKGIEVLSQASVPSEEIRKGVVVDVEKASEKIQEVVLRMRSEVRPRKIKEAYINIGDSHIVAKTGHAAIAISRADQKVSKEDIERVIEEAKNINIPYNQELLDIFPVDFKLDGESGLRDVLGMKGIKLEVDALAICVFSPYLKRLIEAVLGADIEIAGVTPSPILSAEAVLTQQQKELGVVLVDIGAQTTGIAVFEEKRLIHVAVLPVGSANISRDIAVALQVDVDIAEQIKRKFGSYIFQNKRKKEKINIGKDEVIVFDTKKMIKAGRARIAEIFNLVNKELKKISRQESLPAGVVLTGGGSKLSGIVNFAKKELKLPAKRGAPKNFLGLEEDPCYSTLCGAVLKGAGEMEQSRKEGGLAITSRIKKILRIFIP